MCSVGPTLFCSQQFLPYSFIGDENPISPVQPSTSSPDIILFILNLFILTRLCRLSARPSPVFQSCFPHWFSRLDNQHPQLLILICSASNICIFWTKIYRHLPYLTMFLWMEIWQMLATNKMQIGFFSFICVGFYLSTRLQCQGINIAEKAWLSGAYCYSAGSFVSAHMRPYFLLSKSKLMTERCQ